MQHSPFHKHHTPLPWRGPTVQPKEAAESQKVTDVVQSIMSHDSPTMTPSTSFLIELLALALPSNARTMEAATAATAFRFFRGLQAWRQALKYAAPDFQESLVASSTMWDAVIGLLPPNDMTHVDSALGMKGTDFQNDIAEEKKAWVAAGLLSTSQQDHLPFTWPALAMVSLARRYPQAMDLTSWTVYTGKSIWKNSAAVAQALLDLHPDRSTLPLLNLPESVFDGGVVRRELPSLAFALGYSWIKDTTPLLLQRLPPEVTSIVHPDHGGTLLFHTYDPPVIKTLLLAGCDPNALNERGQMADEIHRTHDIHALLNEHRTPAQKQQAALRMAAAHLAVGDEQGLSNLPEILLGNHIEFPEKSSEGFLSYLHHSLPSRDSASPRVRLLLEVFDYLKPKQSLALLESEGSISEGVARALALLCDSPDATWETYKNKSRRKAYALSAFNEKGSNWLYLRILDHLAEEKTLTPVLIQRAFDVHEGPLKKTPIGLNGCSVLGHTDVARSMSKGLLKTVAPETLGLMGQLIQAFLNAEGLTQEERKPWLTVAAQLLKASACPDDLREALEKSVLASFCLLEPDGDDRSTLKMIAPGLWARYEEHRLDSRLATGPSDARPRSRM